MVSVEKVEQIKRQLVYKMETDKSLAVVGRVSDWLKNSESRYPISCTMLSVRDSMEGAAGIEYSWQFASQALRKGAGCAIDLSQLRAKGEDNGRGLVASGPVSFMTIYSELNGTLRRGGTYKNGAIVTYLNVGHADAVEYIEANADKMPWLKKALYVSDNPADPDYLLTEKNRAKIPAILAALNAGTLWLAKKRWNSESGKVIKYPPYPLHPRYNRLYSQVCLEILLPSRGTCTLAHVNLGQLKINEIPAAFERGMRFLCDLHSITGAGKGNMYLSPKEDRQVGLGVLGLANLLAANNIKYGSFVACMEELLYYGREVPTYGRDTLRLCKALIKGFKRANKVASYKKNSMVRAFTVAPTASCSFKYKDLAGYTTAPEISPPICHPQTKRTVRDSDTFGTTEYEYPTNVETAEQVGWDIYYRLVNVWQKLMETTGKAHSISFNLWDQAIINEEWLNDWLLESSALTTYYRMQTQQLYVDKSNINAGGDGFWPPTEDDFFELLDEPLVEAEVKWANDSANTITCDCAE